MATLEGAEATVASSTIVATITAFVEQTHQPLCASDADSASCLVSDSTAMRSSFTEPGETVICIGKVSGGGVPQHLGRRCHGPLAP